MIHASTKHIRRNETTKIIESTLPYSTQEPDAIHPVVVVVLQNRMKLINIIKRTSISLALIHVRHPSIDTCHRNICNVLGILPRFCNWWPSFANKHICHSHNEHSLNTALCTPHHSYTPLLLVNL